MCTGEGSTIVGQLYNLLLESECRVTEPSPCTLQVYTNTGEKALSQSIYQNADVLPEHRRPNREDEKVPENETREAEVPPSPASIPNELTPLKEQG